MTNTTDLHAQIVKLAANAATTEDLAELQSLLSHAGASFERPVGDLPGNQTVISAVGDPEHLVFEAVTNASDAELERYASARRTDGEEVPHNPRALAALVGYPSASPELQQDLALRVNVSLRDSGNIERPTIAVRDHGIGIEGRSVRNTILSLARSPKEGKPYLAGLYGKGGSTLLREAKGTILMGRPSPELLAESGGDDHIWITVVYGIDLGHELTQWVYRTTAAFQPDRPDISGSVLRVPVDAAAAAGIEFDAGTLVTHIAYRAKDIGLRSKSKNDSRSIWVVGNTRLYDPVLPWSVSDDRYDDTAGEPYRLYGRRRMFEGGSPQQMQGSPQEAELPLIDPESGETGSLGVKAFVFTKEARRNATARDHAVLFTINGYAQAVWSPAEVSRRTADARGGVTGLRRIPELMFVAVSLDSLPPRLRSLTVSPDRSGFTDTRLAREIQYQVAQWLVTDPYFHDLERELDAAEVRRVNAAPIDEKLLKEISQKLGLPGLGGGGGGTRRGDPPPPELLLDEPTHLQGPDSVQLLAGEARRVTLNLNAKDGFVPSFAEVAVLAEELELLGGTAPTKLRRGRFSINLLVPKDTPEGDYKVEIVTSWLNRGSSIEQELSWPLSVTVLSERAEKPPPVAAGKMPVVVWDSKATAEVVGEVVDSYTGSEIAAMYSEAAWAAGAGDRRVLAIILNEKYKPWEKWLEKASQASSGAVTRYRNRYVVGVSVGLAEVYGVGRDSTDPLQALDEPTRLRASQVVGNAVIASLRREDES